MMGECYGSYGLLANTASSNVAQSSKAVPPLMLTCVSPGRRITLPLPQTEAVCTHLLSN
jgi:hypothetical protein